MKGVGNLSIGGFTYREERRTQFSMSDGYMYGYVVYGYKETEKNEHKS